MTCAKAAVSVPPGFLGLSGRLLGLTDAEFDCLEDRLALAAELVSRLYDCGLGEALESLLAAHAVDQSTDGETLLLGLGPAAQATGRSIMIGWLLGRFASGEFAQGAGMDVGSPSVMSAKAYRQSLVWWLIGATPMGVRQPGKAPWTLPPRVGNGAA
jgi:hypothetical protein